MAKHVILINFRFWNQVSNGFCMVFQCFQDYQSFDLLQIVFQEVTSSPSQFSFIESASSAFSQPGAMKTTLCCSSEGDCVFLF